MFTFGKNTPEKPTFSKNTLILDYLVRMEKTSAATGRCAFYS